MGCCLGGIGESDHLRVGSSGLGDANGALGCADHWAAVTDHDELGIFGLAGDQGGQPFHIHAVEEAVDLIQGIER